jgi:hypothetical protein
MIGDGGTIRRWDNAYPMIYADLKLDLAARYVGLVLCSFA